MPALPVEQSPACVQDSGAAREPDHLLVLPRSFPFLALLAALGHKDFLQLIEATITDPDRPDLWRGRFAQFHDMSGHDLTGVLHGLQRRLAAFAAPDIARISTHSHRVRLDTLGRQPTTLIVGMQTVNPETIQTYAALIITQLIQQLVRLADRSPGRRLPVPVTIYLDEISNTARIPAIEDNIATLRDKGISFVLGLQDDSGLQQRYGEEAARKIVANLNTKVVLGRNLHIAQAIDTARMAGETTILTHSASAKNRGSSENQHPARRGLVTPDQVRRMEQYEALVFLQEGVITKTRLFPFPPRDPATGEWILLYGSRREQALYYPLRQRLGTLAFDRRMARPRLILRRNGTVGSADEMPQAWPIYRLRHRDLSLDRTLGPLIPSSTPPLPRVPPEPAGQPMEMRQPSPASEEQQAAPPAEEAQQGVDATDKERRSSPDSATSPSPAPTPTESDETSPGGLGEAASPVAPSSVQELDANALGEMTGFFRSIAQRKITVTECARSGAPEGWRITLPEGPFVLVRHSFALAYGERRRTKPQDILDRWRATGLIAARRVDVTVEKPPVQVLAFTPLAVSRFIPAIRDVISTWPVLSRGYVHGLHSPAAEPAPVGQPLLSAQGRPVTPELDSRRTALLRNNPDDALAAVIAWIQANRVALCAPERSEFGQWEAKSRGIPVLLLRTNQAMRILFSRRFDARAILTVWRDQGTIVALPNRFTVYMRAGHGEQANRRTGRTFVAFSWEALEKAGLQR